MKRTIAVVACALALSACGNQSTSSNNQSTNNQSSQSGSSSSTSASASQSKAESGNSSQSKSSPQQFANKKAKRSYALGMDIGNSLKNLPVNLDLGQLTQGVQDVVNGEKTRLSQKEQHAVMQDMLSQMKAAQKKKVSQTAAENLAAGKKFLAENKTKPGVKTLKDGLQYKVIKKGSGAQPDANDSVTVNYTGKLINGKVFDSSEKRGKPVTFPVDAVIPGWTEALQRMHAGGEYKLFIPPKLAYGKRGAGSKIGPNQTLIFDVKLLSVQKNKGSGGNNAGSGSKAGSSDSASTGDSAANNAASSGDAADSGNKAAAGGSTADSAAASNGNSSD